MMGFRTIQPHARRPLGRAGPPLPIISMPFSSVQPADASAREAPALPPEQRAEAMRRLLRGVPDLFRIQTPDDLFAALLRHACLAFGTERAFVAAYADADLDELTAEVEGWMTTRGDVALTDRPLVVRASTGGAQPGSPLDALPPAVRAASLQAVRSNALWTEHGIAMPLRLGTRAVGALYLDVRGPLAQDPEIPALLMETAATALEGALLQAMTSGGRVGELPSRAFVLRRLRQSLRSSARRGEACSLLRADVDAFAEVNRQHGSGAGDLALHAVARMLRFWVRDTDIVGRWGPDEFLVVLPDTPAGGALKLARRLCEQTDQMGVESAGRHVPLRLSFGAASLLPPDPDGIGVVDTGWLDRLAAGLLERAGASLDEVRGTAGVGDIRTCTWSEMESPADAFVAAAMARLPR
ncbi:MAG: response regulator receiver modulated diguanylate cyclase [Gemmatimonadetes bacterium]|nr:response regulator receiver modulated diguanylate cyclase [Gemmatimonadota bacterium]